MKESQIALPLELNGSNFETRRLEPTNRIPVPEELTEENATSSGVTAFKTVVNLEKMPDPERYPGGSPLEQALTTLLQESGLPFNKTSITKTREYTNRGDIEFDDNLEDPTILALKNSLGPGRSSSTTYTRSGTMDIGSTEITISYHREKGSRFSDLQLIFPAYGAYYDWNDGYRTTEYATATVREKNGDPKERPIAKISIYRALEYVGDTQMVDDKGWQIQTQRESDFEYREKEGPSNFIATASNGAEIWVWNTNYSPNSVQMVRPPQFDRMDYSSDNEAAKTFIQRLKENIPPSQ